jgi:hypothetical protein
MKSSPFFRRAIYYEQNPAALEYWEERVQSIFVQDVSQPWVEAYSNTSFKRTDGWQSIKNTTNQAQTESYDDALTHGAAVEALPQNDDYISKDDGNGRLDGEAQRLHLQNLQQKPELL